MSEIHDCVLECSGERLLCCSLELPACENVVRSVLEVEISLVIVSLHVSLGSADVLHALGDVVRHLPCFLTYSVSVATCSSDVSGQGGVSGVGSRPS